MAEKMPKRQTTAGAYRNYLENYCIPQWGKQKLAAIKPMEIWRWLTALDHAPKTKAHIRSVLRRVYEYAMLADLLPITRNPIELVEVAGVSKRSKAKRVLSYEEWERFLSHLTAEPARTAVITCFCLGIRREEVWALKWSDFDFAGKRVMIQRAIVGGKVYTVKTEDSEAPLPLDQSLIRLLLDWRSKSQFNKDSDWVWASPWTADETPLYFNALQRDYIIPAAIKAGLGKIGWHTFRHTYREWLNEGGTELGIQQKLMRHSSPTMTAKYGSRAIGKGMREANSKIVQMVVGDRQLVQ